MSFRAMLDNVRALRNAADSMVDTKWHRNGCDEVSLLFEDADLLLAFVQEAKAHGLEHFNSASDNVQATLTGMATPYSYRVQYEFLRVVPEDWRIEAMALLGGHSPLHHDYLVTRGSGAPVHCSFKCPTLERYEETIKKMEDNGWVKAMDCVSVYGRFSYWQHREWPSWAYVKPRVNLRDA